VQKYNTRIVAARIAGAALPPLGARSCP
jgi:hypothetical protein